MEEVPIPMSPLSRRIASGEFTKDFTNSTTPHDRVIVVEEQKFYVLSGFLSFYSEFFLTMFTADFKEKDQQEIVVEDVTAHDFNLFLQALIPSNHAVIKEENYKAVIFCARRFMTPHILRMCEEFIIDTTKDNNMIEHLVLAFKLNLSEVKEQIKIYLTREKQNIGICLNYGCRSSNLNPDNKYCASCRYESEKKGMLSKSSFVVRHQEELKELSVEVQLFVLHSLLEKAK